MEDTILTLCGRMLAAKDDDEIRPMIVELRDELHQYIEHLRIRLAEYPIVIERRVGNGLSSPNAPTPENAAQKSRSATALTNRQA
jgi:hypothetical protein